jgi:hypothetical protein
MRWTGRLTDETASQQNRFRLDYRFQSKAEFR